MDAVSTLRFRRGRGRTQVEVVLAATLLLVLLAYAVVGVLLADPALQPDAELVAPFRWAPPPGGA